MSAPLPTPWFDAHLDLACLAVLGRDMLATNLAAAAGPHTPAGVTIPALLEGHVTHVLGTIFLEQDGADAPIAYAAGDAAAAHARALDQLRVYEQWGAADLIAPLRDKHASAPLRLGILIEGADALRHPGELHWWVERGVVAVGMAWWKSSRYAGGNGSHDGLTDAGRELVREIDRLGVVHDVSHLSDRASDELFDLAQGPIIASHSNCRALLGDPANQRHLTDEHIRTLVTRAAAPSPHPSTPPGGVIGLNLFSKFLAPDAAEDRRATVDDCVAHIEHICMIAGSTRHVGLGSDMDGGFSAARLPAGIDRPAHLARLADALSRKGWSDEEVRGFAFTNWARALGVN